MANYMVMISGLYQEQHVSFSLLWYKGPDLKPMEGEGGFDIQKWRLYKSLEGSSGKKVHLGLKSV